MKQPLTRLFLLRNDRKLEASRGSCLFAFLQYRQEFSRRALEFGRRGGPADHVRERNPDDVAELGDRDDDRQPGCALALLHVIGRAG